MLPGQSIDIAEASTRLHLNNNSKKIQFNQGIFDDGQDDYAYRLFFWSSSRFKINDNARFGIDDNGNSYISNLIIEPDGADDFDWDGGTFAEFFQPYVKPLIDPFDLGGDDPFGNDRRVTINFNGTLAPLTYTRQNFSDDYNAGQTTVSGRNPSVDGLAASNADLVAAGAKVIVNGIPFISDLYNRKAIKYHQGDYYVLYGTNDDDNLSVNKIWPHLSYVTEAVGSILDSFALLGGKDDDTLNGGFGDDRLDGGEDSDTIEGGFGDDLLIANL